MAKRGRGSWRAAYTGWGRRRWRSARPGRGKKFQRGEKRAGALMGRQLAEPGRIASQAERGEHGEMILPEGMRTVWQGQVVLDPGDFLRKLRGLTRRLGRDRVTQVAADLAWFIIAQSIKSPVPRDTGFLSRSGNVEANPRRQEVLFGFNTPYALIQDIGSKRLPPKEHGSDVGPNLYFSQTLKERASWLYSELVRKLQAMAAGA